MRLTPEFVSKTSSHLNALKERELDLRGLAIPVIENLASHQGTYDVLNLTDNSLTVLGNIPLTTRLSAIHAGKNSISSISPSLPSSIPNLVTLVLTDNAITSLGALVPLENLPHLRHLVLRGNPVTEQKHYREFVIWKAAKGDLHTLDFVRIKDAERESAKVLFTDAETGRPNELAHKLATQVGVAAPKVVASGKGRLMTPEEKRRVLAALTAAQTAEEVRKLERMLADGLIPEGESIAA